ncbi:MAG: ATP-NAD kinase, partial [Clostridia bacterium]|nr:ATP-NAD kinase [Clostridia bacterium]
MKKIGFIVNPVAGIGGKVGLKGSDGTQTLKKALELGAVPEAGAKALAAMKLLRPVEKQLEIHTCPGNMGEDICKKAGLDCCLVQGT